MARRPQMEGPNPFADLDKKILILEREMAVQRAAIARLKALGETRRANLSTDEDRQSDLALDRV